MPNPVQVYHRLKAIADSRNLAIDDVLRHIEHDTPMPPPVPSDPWDTVLSVCSLCAPCRDRIKARMTFTKTTVEHALRPYFWQMLSDWNHGRGCPAEKGS